MSNASKPPGMIKRFITSVWSWLLLLLIIAGYVALTIKTTIDNTGYILTPPGLPLYQATSEANTIHLNPTGWPDKSSQAYRHSSVGAATIPIPYSWLLALESPKQDPLRLLSGKEPLFVDEYLPRLGFIKQKKTASNPNGLPIGLTKTPNVYFPGIDRKDTAAGFNCAACHTGQLIHGDTRYIVDGAPANIDFGLLNQTLGAALAQTVISAKVPVYNDRFSRFAERVLGNNDNRLSRQQLSAALSKTVRFMSEAQDSIEVTEGFSRLDTMNRIGNQVFGHAMQRSENHTAINAPVNFPHLWTTPWFNWLQYDGSIMQPLVRNTSETLGTKAYLDTQGPAEQRFATSAGISDLVKMQNWLAGKHPKRNDNTFNGLSEPTWPETFPAIDKEMTEKGKTLYQQHCQECHLPSVDSDEFWEDKNWQKITYVSKLNTITQTPDSYLKLNIVPLSVIGTDAAQAEVMAKRTVDTTGLNLATQVCTPAKSVNSTITYASAFAGMDDIPADMTVLRHVPFKDSATANFGLALGAVVDQTNQQWFKQNHTPRAEQAGLEGNRPNCLQVGKGYKARPLNGIWATAPFLHNGSVPTLYDLLSPLEDRPDFVQLGSHHFDAGKVGIQQDESLNKKLIAQQSASHSLTPDYKDGLFILDTRQAGNRNTGHVFDDEETESVSGIIGPKLTEEEKLALIEYLKSL
ncbi:di-heme-cytochrome C peroxidase [Leucothrix pacifica]|uniref:Cytochrome c domain-containing protein n=1 Tax=Leucothrix pacifica TaxID=1247513 RepID=A0A317C285_9GAMM|nr:di-heme-cytochrome C peroxidase [Leucothrix pacifica]PWQ92776.1 hypothetical protein DKW60_19400 [Leucothrix pacifica]